MLTLEYWRVEFERNLRSCLLVLVFLKEYELKLHINESVKPVVKTVRRTPFVSREKVDKF